MTTITFVGAGAAVTGNNASITPPVHVSTAAGDLVVILATIRNSGTGTVNTPAGWSALATFGNETLLGRFWVAGDTAPLITFAGGVANADTTAHAATWRGVSREALGATATQLNAVPDANIAYPALVVAKDRYVALIALWKQSVIAAPATPGGFTAIGLASSAAGDDAGHTWYYQIQTTATSVSNAFPVFITGPAAISRAIVLTLKPAATFTATPQVVYPPRVLLSLTDLTLGDAVQLYRSVSGVRTLVRAGTSAAVTDPSFLRVDAELPFGVPVTYVAVVNGIEYTVGPTTYTLTGGKVALSDAVAGTSAEVVILAWPEKNLDRAFTRFRVGGRNVVVSGDLMSAPSDVSLFVTASSSVDNVLDLLDSATQGIIQVRQPGGYDGVDAYWAVLGVTVRRFSQDGSDQRRTIVLTVVEVEGWAPTLQSATYTYADLETAYTGLTYANLNADYATYLLLAQASF